MTRKFTKEEEEFISFRKKLSLKEFMKITPPVTMKVCPTWGCDFGIVDFTKCENLPKNERIKYTCLDCNGLGYVIKE